MTRIAAACLHVACIARKLLRRQPIAFHLRGLASAVLGAGS